MSGKQLTGDGIPANLAGMSKNQLYDIMSQMKTLIEQNQQQARQILIQNPILTKALFQAQIMLGMVQVPQMVPNIQPSPSQHLQQTTQTIQQPNVQTSQSFSAQVGTQDQTGASQIHTSQWKQHQSQPVLPNSSAAAPTANIQSQPMPSHPLQMPQQPKGQLNPHVTPTSFPQSSQLSNVPSLPLHSSQPHVRHPPQMPTSASQSHQPTQTSGIPHMPLQPPLPPQARPTSLPTFHHQYSPQIGSNVGFQHSGTPQHISQPMFHPGVKPPASIGPGFPHGQPQLSNQPPHQSIYQGGGMHLGTEFNNQVGSSMPTERGPSRMSGPPENATMTHFSAPPQLIPGQMGLGSQHPRPPLTPEMEKALLQQVMSLTPEQINLLPPEQRNQVLQLQQILRQ